MPGSVHLLTHHPDGTTRAFELTEHDTFLLGRMNDCHLCLPNDSQVSRHHFLLEACPPQAALRDLGSMNGTHLNGKKVGGREKGESPEQGALRAYPSIDLKHGDRITVGQSTIEVRIEAAPDNNVVAAALPEGDLSGLSPEAMRQLILGSPEKAIFSLAGYSVQRELGRGGCGAVYLSTPKSGGDPVAVKLMLSRAQAEPRAIEHFKREMQVIAGLKHPNIVRFLDSGSDQGTFFFWRTRLRRLELRRLPLPTPHRQVPLPLRSQARPHRHHPQRKPRPHPRPHAGAGEGNRHRHRQGPRPESQRPLPLCRETARRIFQMTR
jgi:hypothetical protein